MSGTTEVVEGYAPAIRPAPRGGGRAYRTARTVRLGDVGPDGRLRLDAAARYAQDVASDDVRDAGLDGRWGWVVRRTSMAVLDRPGYEEEVALTTWCAALGAAWAERRTTVWRDGRPAFEISALWVCLDPGHRRPVALEPEFLEVYGPSAGAARVPRRLLHPEPPQAPGQSSARSWSWRHSDLDSFGHVNNAAVWEVVDDEMARRHPGQVATAASVEHREAIGPAAQVSVAGAEDGAAGLGLWIVDSGGAVLATAMVGWRAPTTSRGQPGPPGHAGPRWENRVEP